MTNLLRLSLALATALAFEPVAAQGLRAGDASFELSCRPPLKFAAGACVPECPAGYEDRGRFCTYRNLSSGGGGGGGQ